MRAYFSRFCTALCFAAAFALPACAAPKLKLKTETIAKGLKNPWGMAFLPDGRVLVTERGGAIRLVTLNLNSVRLRQGGREVIHQFIDGSTISPPLKGVPKVYARGQGGMLDVAISPNFTKDKLVFFSFAEPRGRGANATAVGRGRLVEDARGARLTDVKVIFRQQPAFRSSAHFGSRLVFARDGTLFVTTGDRFLPRDQAQNPANHLGKIIRINPDGSAPRDNPRLRGWAPEVWSIGHRNVQGAALNPATGELWTAEHGARGGDEINRPRRGRNYGWPVITYGRDYNGSRIGIGTAKAGMEQPLFYWDPSIAPSGAAFYTGDVFPQWKGSLFVGALRGRHLVRLKIAGNKVVGQEKLLTGLRERIRAVLNGPDGALWLLTDSANGRILRVVPQANTG